MTQLTLIFLGLVSCPLLESVVTPDRPEVELCTVVDTETEAEPVVLELPLWLS